MSIKDVFEYKLYYYRGVVKPDSSSLNLARHIFSYKNKISISSTKRHMDHVYSPLLPKAGALSRA